MNQQRSRRFRSAKESMWELTYCVHVQMCVCVCGNRDKHTEIEEIKERLRSQGLEVPSNDKAHFDSNCITPVCGATCLVTSERISVLRALSSCQDYQFASNTIFMIVWTTTQHGGDSRYGMCVHSLVGYVHPHVLRLSCPMPVCPERGNTRSWTTSGSRELVLTTTQTLIIVCVELMVWQDCKWKASSIGSNHTADLIMLGLATHEVQFTILREEFNPSQHQNKPCEICNQRGEPPTSSSAGVDTTGCVFTRAQHEGLHWCCKGETGGGMCHCWTVCVCVCVLHCCMLFWSVWWIRDYSQLWEAVLVHSIMCLERGTVMCGCGCVIMTILSSICRENSMLRALISRYCVLVMCLTCSDVLNSSVHWTIGSFFAFLWVMTSCHTCPRFRSGDHHSLTPLLEPTTLLP